MPTSEAEIQLAVIVRAVDAERRERRIACHRAVVAGGELRGAQSVVALVGGISSNTLVAPTVIFSVSMAWNDISRLVMGVMPISVL